MQQRFDVGREILKLIAVVTMTVDHVGFILCNDHVVLRIIGRLSFPIFCYLIILGMESTRNVKNYFTRLFIFALVSQVPYYLAFGLKPFEQLNIFFTLSSGVLFLHFFKNNPALSLLLALASVFLNFDFGLYGIALIALMRVLKEDTNYGIILIVLLNVFFVFLWNPQIFSLFALPIILLHKSGFLKIKKEVKGNTAYPLWRKYLFYVYYPLHLAVLYLIKLSF